MNVISQLHVQPSLTRGDSAPRKTFPFFQSPRGTQTYSVLTDKTKIKCRATENHLINETSRKTALCVKLIVAQVDKNISCRLYYPNINSRFH